jgi:hypothetical protein
MDNNLMKSDDTVIPSPRVGRANQRAQRENSEQQSIAALAALDNNPSPNPPQRRSSLAKSPGSKLRKRPLPSPPPAPFPQLPTAAQKDSNPNRRSRITSKLFGLGRSESYNPQSESSPAPVMNGNGIGDEKKMFTRSQSYGAGHAAAPRGGGGQQAYNKRHSVNLNDMDLEGLHSASATPPPISRYPRQISRGNTAPQRPMTAVSLESKFDTRRIDYGVDGASDEKDAEAGAGPNNGNKGRKWFGLGRNNSLRR